jgi:rubredoxin
MTEGQRVCPKCGGEKYLHESKALHGLTSCLSCGYIGHEEKVR